MATMQTRSGNLLRAEFILTGRYWLAVGVAVLCLAGAISLHVTRDHPWVGLRWWMWQAAGVSLQQRQDLYTAVFVILALMCVVWTLAGPLLARRVIVTSDGVTIYRAQLGSTEPVVVPFVAMRDVGQRKLPPRRGRSELLRRADPYFHFSFNGRDFGFRRFAFQSDRDFERFCTLVAGRAGRLP